MKFKVGTKYYAPRAVDQFLDMVGREAEEMPEEVYGDLPKQSLMAEIRYPDKTVLLQCKRFVMEAWECVSIEPRRPREIPLP